MGSKDSCPNPAGMDNVRNYMDYVDDTWSVILLVWEHIADVGLAALAIICDMMTGEEYGEEGSLTFDAA